MSILILHDAIQFDRLDSLDTLEQAKFIASVLRDMGAAVSMQSVPDSLPELSYLLEQTKPTLVFNLIETWQGQDHLTWLPVAVIEAHGIAYTGVSAAALQRCADKITLNQFLDACDIPVPPSFSPQSSLERYIVKSATAHASFGLQDENVVSRDNVPAFLNMQQQRYQGAWMAEAYIEGREFNIGLLQEGKALHILPPAEILFANEKHGAPNILNYASKWQVDSEGYQNTPRRFDFDNEDTALLERIRITANQCWKLLNLSGYARVDFRVGLDGSLYVIDINTNPCLSSDAGFMAATARIGKSPQEVLRCLLETAADTMKHLKGIMK